METQPVKSSFKQKLKHEMIEYAINALYLVIFFGLFATYRRLILRHYSIDYLNYGMAIIEALVMAKVILLLDALHVGRKLEDKPLIYSTLYKAAIFTIGVFIFSVLEHVVEALFKGTGTAGMHQELLEIDKYELTAKCLVVFFTFIPFFAFKELGRILGEHKITQLFFSQRLDTTKVQ